MPEDILPNNHINGIPYEMLDTILDYLPAFSLTGEHSARSVCHKWNTSSKLSKRNTKATNQQIVDSIKTPEEALHFLENMKIFNEMDYKRLLCLVCKIPQIRDALIPQLTLGELAIICEYDIDCARRCLDLEGLNKFQIRSCHEILCDEYLKNNPNNPFNPQEAKQLSQKYISVARRILAIPDFIQRTTVKERFEIIANHTQLVEENLQLCSEFWDEADEFEHLEIKMLFIQKHCHSKVVASFLINKFSAVPVGEFYFERFTFLLNMAGHHWEMICEMLNERDWAVLFNAPNVMEFLDKHFEVAKKYITRPDLVLVTSDYTDNIFHIIMQHFPNSKSFLLDEAYRLGTEFYKEYGPVLALPRMQRLMTNSSATPYDFKLALAKSLFENPKLFFYLNDKIPTQLAMIIDELRHDDFSVLKPAIITIFENEALKKRLNPFLALKLLSKMPYELQQFMTNESDVKRTFNEDTFTSIPAMQFRRRFFLNNPVLARSFMDNEMSYNSFDESTRKEIKSILDQRSLIIGAVESLKQANNANVTLNP